MKQYLLYILISLLTFSPAVRGEYTTHHKSKIESFAIPINGFTIQPIASQTYTGLAIEPLVTVSDAAGTILTDKVDYTVAYSQNINAGTAYVTVTGTGDYEGTLTSSFIINRARLTITAHPQTMTYGTTPSSLNLEGAYDITGFVNNEEQSVLRTLPTVYIYSSITSTTPIGTYNSVVRVSGATADNYTISYAHNSLTITQNTGNGYLTFDPIGDKTYGNGSFSLNGRHALGKAITFESSNPNVVSVSGYGSSWTATIHNAGDVVLTMKFAGDDDIVAEEVEQKLTVARAQLYVTALPQERGYGEENPNVSGSYCMSGFVNASDASGFTSHPNAYINPEYGVRTEPGTYTGGVLISGGEHPNYIINYSYGTLTIESIIRHIYFAPFCGKTYGDPSFNLSASHAGGLPVKFESLNPDVISVKEVNGVWIATIENKGTATIRAYVEGDTEYDATEKFQDINVARTPLTIYTVSKSRYYAQDNPEFTLSFSGLKYDDSINDLGTIDITCAATEKSNVGSYTIFASGAVNPNYIISYSYGSLYINRATLNVKAKEVENIFGTPPSSLDLTGAYEISGFLLGDNEAVLINKPTVRIDGSITATIPVGIYEGRVLVSGTTAQNYTAVHTNNTLTVKQNTGKGYVSFDPIGDKTYGDAPFSLSGRHAMGYPITFESSDPSVVSITYNGHEWIATIHKAGTVVLKAVFGGDENIVGEEVELQLTIHKAMLTVTARNQVRAFAQENPDISNAYDFGDFVNAEDESLFVTRPKAQIDPAYNTTTPTGTYKEAVLVSGGEHPSYEMTYIPGSLTIEPAVGDIEFPTLGNKIYGDASFNLSATHTGGNIIMYESLNPDVISVIQDAAGWKATIHKVGETAIRAYTKAGNNYLEAEKTQDIIVSPAQLSIRPDDKMRYYGEENPDFTLSFSGLKYNDTAENLGQISISTTAVTESDAATYPIEASGAENSNYIISYNKGTLTVKKAVLVLTFGDGNAIYTGSQLFISPASLSGIVGDGKYPITYTYLKDKETSSHALNAGTYTVTANVTGDENHEDASTTAKFVVDKATPKIQLTSVTSEYTGNPVPVNTPVVTGSTTVGNLSLTIKYKGTGSTNYPETSEAPFEYGTYEATVSTTGDDNHYPASSKTTISISQKAPSMSMIGESKTYDGTPLALKVSIEPKTLEVKYSYEGTLKDGTEYGPSEQAPTEAGNYIVTASTEGDRNYTAATVTADIEITKKAASIVMNNKSTPYIGQQISIETPVAEPADAELIITYAGTGNTIYPESANAPRWGGTYIVKATYAGNNNYLPAQATASLSITNAGSPTLTIDNKTVTYNGSPQTIGSAKVAPEYAGYLTVTYTYSNADYPSTETPPTNAGVYTVTASTPADENFKAGSVTATLTIKKANQIITFPELGTKLLEDEPFNARVSINTRLPLTYSSGNPNIANIAADGTITILKSGTATITAMQEGNENYEPATMSRTLNITSDDATIHRLTINGQAINVEDNMHYDLLCRETTDFRIIVETETNAMVSTGKLFTVVVDKPMLKVIEIKVTSQDGTKTKTYTLTIEKRFDFDAIVITRWNNTMTIINNPENNGGYRFTSFKWFRNDEELATGQSYSAGSKGESLIGTDRYFVEVTSNDFEGVLRSCEGYPNLKSMTVKAYPNPVALNETIYVEADVEDGLLDGAVIEIYNISGVKIKQVKAQGRLTPVNIDKGSLGTYIFKLKGKEGFSRDVKVVVK